MRFIPYLLGFFASVSGSVLVFGLVLAMNALDRGPPEPPPARAVSFDVQASKKAPPARQSRPPRERPKPQRTPPPPAPIAAMAAGGLDLGLWGGTDVDLGGAADALVGNVEDVVMTADAVDSLPVAVRQAAIDYPSVLQRQGVTGGVLVQLTIDPSGRVSAAEVLESDPPGVFDDIALRGVKQWVFQPCTYNGAAVACTVEQPLRFDLER